MTREHTSDSPKSGAGCLAPQGPHVLAMLVQLGVSNQTSWRQTGLQFLADLWGLQAGVWKSKLKITREAANVISRVRAGAPL